MTTERAVVRLTLQKPQTLADLRYFMATAVTLGMPSSASVSCSHQELQLAAFLDGLE